MFVHQKLTIKKGCSSWYEVVGVGEDSKMLIILGNGVQQAFYEDPNVLYISIHVHENGRFYPAGDYGDHLHCGLKAGVGK